MRALRRIVDARRSQTAHAHNQQPYINLTRPRAHQFTSSLWIQRTVTNMSVEEVQSQIGHFRHSHGEDDTEGVLMAKGVAMAVLFVASMVCGLIPMLLARRLRWTADEAGDLKSSNRIVMTLLSFGGGVLLSTTFMHLIPEVDENVTYLQG